jgi:hypothetical protein
MEVLDYYCRPYNNHGMGVPFSVDLNGRIDYVSYQNGFVGQQISIGYHFLRESHRSGNSSLGRKGNEILKFWVENSLSEAGVPKVWYDPMVPRFRTYPSFLRMIADGTEFVLKAYQLEKKYGTVHADWLEYCLKTADFLVSVQGEDGSFARAYTWEGTIQHPAKNCTAQPIRFLTWLYLETKDEKYLSSALKSAEYTYESLHKPFCYMGGTPDNDNVFDKEAGILMLYGFLELFEATGDNRWLEVAVGAADYCEGWIYTYNFPVSGEYPHNPYDKTGIAGQSPVTIYGGAGGDNFMSFTTTYYYRLYRITGDRHYLDYAVYAQNSSKSATDYRGILGYRFRGLSPEGVHCPLMVYTGGFRRWLPWSSMAQVEPVCDLEDRYGCKNIEEVEAGR